jgi:soluble cytochrome b562
VQERAEDDAGHRHVDGRDAEHHGDDGLIVRSLMPSSPSRHRLARLGARALGGVAVLAATAVAGCGGDSSSPTTATSAASTTTATAGAATGALNHAQLVAQADAACQQASQAIAKIPAARSLDALADYAGQVRDVGSDLHDRLSALTPTAADRAAYAKYLDGLDASNQALDAMRTAAQNGDASAVRAAARTIDATAVGVLATRAGLAGCAATSADGTGS